MAMKPWQSNGDSTGIAYARQGTGVPLVLIHGYPLDRSIWEPLVGPLGEDFELIMPDLRGFGGSHVADASGSIDAYGSDVTGLLRQLQVPRAIVAGHSMGGYVALGIVRHHPEMVAGLCLVEGRGRDWCRQGSP